MTATSTFDVFTSGPDRDPWLDRMLAQPWPVISSTVQGPSDRRDATVLGGDGVEAVQLRTWPAG